MSVMPPPIVVRPASWNDCRCACAQQRFYEEFGFEDRYRLIAGWQRLVRWVGRLRKTRFRLTKPAAQSSCR